MNLWEIEQTLKAAGHGLICGVDEAGRGPLAGPVVAAAVILPEGIELPGLDDSKKLKEAQRESLFEQIQQGAVAYGIGLATEAEIDQVNILNATYLAMNRAIENLGRAPDLSLIDGNRANGVNYPHQCIVGGDAKCACIAAASILAKVTRDKIMKELHEVYPQYGFGSHKGYPTKAHYAALDVYGPSPIHRQSFLKKWKQA